MDVQTATRKRAPRRDAQQRREALITAATACFQDLGYDVPLEVIAERAGVGRGTLYRNFHDREALALAIFSREVDRFEETFDTDAPIEDILASMIRDGAAATSLFRRIATELHQSDANLTAFQTLRQRLERLLAPVVTRAQARGELHGGVSPHDLVLAMQMAGGLLYAFLNEEEIATQVNAALSLLLVGLRPR